jgi:hypothetical protein
MDFGLIGGESGLPAARQIYQDSSDDAGEINVWNADVGGVGAGA